MKQPALLYLLCGLHLFLSLGALTGGFLMIINPNGSLLGMNPAWLQHSPFTNYLIPGLILFTFNGLFPLLVIIGLVLKPNWHWANAFNIYPDRHWGWTYSLYSGIIIITWITVQIMMTQYFWLQPVMIFTGLLILIFTLTPSVMNTFKNC